MYLAGSLAGLYRASRVDNEIDLKQSVVTNK
jgi:hypothetical protein